MTTATKSEQRSNVYCLSSGIYLCFVFVFYLVLLFLHHLPLPSLLPPPCAAASVICSPLLLPLSSLFFFFFFLFIIFSFSSSSSLLRKIKGHPLSLPPPFSPSTFFFSFIFFLLILVTQVSLQTGTVVIGAENSKDRPMRLSNQNLCAKVQHT